jgi:flagellar hook assembly protein FlgD
LQVTVTKANYYRYEEDVPVVQVGVVEGDFVSSAPTSFSVKNIIPNPFKENTVVCYGLPVRAKTTVTVYDVLGKLVTTLHDGIQHPGWHTITWDGGDEHNLRSPAGVYFYEIKTEISSVIRKLILLK